MKFCRLSPISLWLLLLPLCLYTAPAQGADATSFDPTLVSVEAKSSGGVPVGTIVAWPVATNPSDWDKWLECNGQSISQAVYPELFAVLGANVPDLRGLFLRGYGEHSGNHSSEKLGIIQLDEIKKHTLESTVSVLLAGGTILKPASEWGVTAHHGTVKLEFTTGGTETRPVNTSVRYLIRALP